MTQRTDIKDPLELVPYTADFTDRLAAIDVAETITSVTSVVATVYQGTDTAPSAILSGGTTISGSKKVVQLITGGLDGVDYKIKIDVLTSTGKQLVIAGIVPVRSK